MRVNPELGRRVDKTLPKKPGDLYRLMPCAYALYSRIDAV